MLRSDLGLELASPVGACPQWQLIAGPVSVPFARYPERFVPVQLVNGTNPFDGAIRVGNAPAKLLGFAISACQFELPVGEGRKERVIVETRVESLSNPLLIASALRRVHVVEIPPETVALCRCQ